jgi:HEAT repeat protein
MAQNAPISDLEQQFLASQWPRCNEIARSLAALGGEEAVQALVAGLSARRHHVRTAAIEALASFGDITLVEPIRPHLSDPSYETRMAAKAAIRLLTGQAVVTARGE